jgi:tetratricopeptide (TPR) repeat protein
MKIMISYKRAAAAIAAGLCALAAGAPALAQPAWVPPGRPPSGFTVGELAVLPDYCKDVQGVYYGDATNPSPRAGYWLGVIGPDLWHLHHYCRALVMERRASQPGISPGSKSEALLRANADYEYMMRAGSLKDPLMPEILLRYGDLLVRLNNLPEAERQWKQARDLKPDYWPAYTRWIDVLMGLKLFERAGQLAEEGLQYAPDNRELLERAATLEKKHRVTVRRLPAVAAKSPAPTQPDAPAQTASAPQ